jgi:hypothetical protein
LRIHNYLARFAPRRPITDTPELISKHRAVTSDFAHQLVPALTREVAAPIPG